MFPYLVPVTKEGPRSALFEQQHVTALDPEEAVAIAVEFRDSSWLPGHGDEVLRFLAQHDLTYV